MIVRCDPPACPMWLKGVGFVGCGHCPRCLALKRLEWSIRIDAESRCHEDNSFVTFTYDDEHLPSSLSLDRMQRFWKSFRKEWPVRYFCAGEYGDQYARPHYHAALFGVGLKHPCFSGMKFDQKKHVWRGRCKHWPDGFVAVGNLSPASAQYIAKYILKRSDQGYWGREVGSDVLNSRLRWFKDIPADKEPEFQVMSRRPGIGYEYIARYGHELLARDSYVLDGKKVLIPQYFKQKIFSDAERVVRADKYFADCIKEWNKDVESEFVQRLKNDDARKSLFGKKGALDDQSKDSDKNDCLFVLDNPSFY